MSNEYSENKKITAETEIGSNGVGHSKPRSSGGAKASPEELSMALVAAESTITKMKAELEALKASKEKSTSSSEINTLVKMLSEAIVANKAPTGPTEDDNINRTNQFKERTNIDGASLMEAQATMLAYRNEEKEMISVPKAFQSRFGPSLVITVNGVRVAIPCDGKSYPINKTHAVHARERIAKVDLMLSDDQPQITEINA